MSAWNGPKTHMLSTSAGLESRRAPPESLRRAISFLVVRILAALLVIAAPASAAILASEDDNGTLREGLYLAGGGGPQLFITGENTPLGYDLEGRLGYSFNPRTQLYLSAAFDTTSIT